MAKKKTVKSVFVIGDKVRILNPSNYESIRTWEGMEGRISKVSEGMQTVKFDKGTCMFFNDELEVI